MDMYVTAWKRGKQAAKTHYDDNLEIRNGGAARWECSKKININSRNDFFFMFHPRRVTDPSPRRAD